MKVTIELNRGTIAVRGDIGVPVQADAKTLQFGLHETLAIKKLLVSNRRVSQGESLGSAGEPSFTFPATKKVIVNLPAPVAAGMLQVEIEYHGLLKKLPEFGAFADQRPAMDDQINSRLGRVGKLLFVVPTVSCVRASDRDCARSVAAQGLDRDLLSEETQRAGEG